MKFKDLKVGDEIYFKHATFIDKVMKIEECEDGGSEYNAVVIEGAIKGKSLCFDPDEEVERVAEIERRKAK
jgi:hypothetical protein